VTEDHIAVIGGLGKMGVALIDGLLAAGHYEPDAITATSRHRRSQQRAAERGIRHTRDNRSAVEGASLVVLAVQPRSLGSVIDEIRAGLAESALVVSIVTGAPTRRIERLLQRPLPVVRASPNIAAVVGSSMTAICLGRHADRQHQELARRVFSTVGRVVRLEERHMDSCTGLGGCGPAFAFKIIEALAEGGVKMGLPRDVSRIMAAQVLRGAADLVLETGRHPAALKDEVTTPGGCTIDGITKLEERGLPIALIEAVEVSSVKAGMLVDEDD